MSNLSIDTLPLLSYPQFSPYSDYIVVQKPNGQTYKMLLADAYGASNTAGSNYTFTDGKSFDMSGSQNPEISFKENRLIDESTSFLITITTTTLASGSNSVSEDPINGTSIVYQFTKPTDSKFINQNISLGSSAQQNIAEFAGFYKGSSNRSYYPTTTYWATIDTTVENTIKLKFGSSIYGYWGDWKHQRSYYPAYKVRVSTKLQANIV